MYDAITFDDVRESFAWAVDVLPVGYLTAELCHLFERAATVVEENAFFEFDGVVRRIVRSQIQGSQSGSDTCSMVCKTKEIRATPTIARLTKLMLRYKDDILIMPARPLSITNERDFEQQIVHNIYTGFGFETEAEWPRCRSVVMCDINIYVLEETGKLGMRSETTSSKVRSYVLKSSNVKQNVNGTFNTLQERYIIINPLPKDYTAQKRRVCEIFMRNEWTGFDLRKARHLKHSDRARYLARYAARKAAKYRSYANMYKISLYDRYWFRIDESEPDAVDINLYMTYQKTLIDEKAIKRILYKSTTLLPDKIQERFSFNLYHKYQPNLSCYTRLS